MLPMRCLSVKCMSVKTHTHTHPGVGYLQASSVSLYQGKDRGVLLQLGQSQMGHFPLGLWDEDKTQPPPNM